MRTYRTATANQDDGFRVDEKITLKSLVDRFIALPADDEEKAELFDAIEQWVYSEFAAEDGMTAERLAQIDITELAQCYIDRARFR